MVKFYRRVGHYIYHLTNQFKIILLVEVKAETKHFVKSRHKHKKACLLVLIRSRQRSKNAPKLFNLMSVTVVQATIETTIPLILFMEANFVSSKYFDLQDIFTSQFVMSYQKDYTHKQVT